MFKWLKRVLGNEKQTTEVKTETNQAAARVIVDGKRPSSAAEIPSSLPGRAQAQQYLEKVQVKINQLADDFAAGTINRGQFQELYAHYQREIRAIEGILEVDQQGEQWQEAMTEGESVVIRKRHAARARGYAIYENESGMPLSTLGKFEVDPALFVPMLSAYRAATQEIFGAGIQATAIESGRWLCFVPGELTTMMALFSAEPAPKQLDFLEKLHRLFEKANAPLLSNPPVDTNNLVFPHEHFLGKWRR